MVTSDALATILSNLSEALLGLEKVFYTMAGVLGFLLLGFGLWRLTRVAKYGESALPALGSCSVGVLLFGLEAFTKAASLTLFEEEASLSSQINKISNPSVMAPYLKFAVTVVVLLGIISLIRGFLRLRAASLGQEESLWPGLTH